MNKFIASTAAAVFALSLAATSFAAAPVKDLGGVDSNGNVAEVDFRSNLGSLDTAASQNVSEFISSWSLGPINFDVNGGVKIMDVKAPAGISVALNDASSGATSDKVDLNVTADAGVQAGTYPVTVTLENAQFGDEGTITFNVVVQ
jgi:hypothetical protein